jgi:hypothetical protein
MKTIEPTNLRRYLFQAIFLISILFEFFTPLDCHAVVHDNVAVSLIGVHHLGPDYLIQKFYINKTIGDNVGEGGGGGSMVCCITLPRKWQRSLVVDVRWEVARIIRRSTNSDLPDVGEIEGIYQAQVPVEQYTEPGNFSVHFLPNGHVYVVVNPTESENKHTTGSSDTPAVQTATKGQMIKALFTPQEIIERKKAANNDRNNYGGWR